MSKFYIKFTKISFLIILFSILDMVAAFAHGEKAMEPYFRTRTVMFYDVTWTSDKVSVGEDIEVEGTFRFHSDWPQAVDDPDVIFVTQSIFIKNVKITT